MSSPITLSGFNNVDFGLIIDAILRQERVPIRNLETARILQVTKRDAYSQLASKLAAVDSASSALATASGFERFTASADSSGVLTASAGVGAAAGTHTVTVTALAKAQVLATTSLVASTDTVVADGGSLVVGGKSYAATGATTLGELRDRINADASGVARASLVETGSGLKLVLTAKSSGAASAFTVQNSLTLASGSSLVVFADTDGDGVSGDSSADNAVSASDAALLIDNIAVTRSSNLIENALPGVTLSLSTLGSTNVTVAADLKSVKSNVEALVNAYNDFSRFIQQQYSASGTAGPLASDSLVRSASSEVRAILRGSVESGGAFRNLAEIGIVFERTGDLSINHAKLDSSLSNNLADVRKLFQTSFSTSDSRIRGLGRSPATVSGTYDVQIDALASTATTGGSRDINGQINSDETLTFTYGSLETSVFLPQNSDITDIVGLVNTALGAAGIAVTASDVAGVLTLVANQAGSAGSFTVVSDVADSGNGKSTGIGTTLRTASGVDIAGTIGGLAATGFGNILTGGLGGATEGLEIEASTTVTGYHGTVTVSDGLESRLSATLDRYLGSAGLLKSSESRIGDAIGALNKRIAAMEERLALREQELRLQFTYADQAISSLNAQLNSLGSLTKPGATSRRLL